LQVSVLAADCFGRPRKKTPAICDGSSFGRNAASQSQRRKLTTFRPVRLWLFTHSTAAIGGPKSRDHAVNGRSGLGRCQLAETVMSARLWLRFSNNSATRAHLLEQIDGLGADLTPERGLPRPASPKSSVARPSAAAHFHKTKMRGCRTPVDEGFEVDQSCASKDRRGNAVTLTRFTVGSTKFMLQEGSPNDER